MNRLNYLWRLSATALSFGLFGVGGVLIGLLLVPLSMLLPLRDREGFGKTVIHHTFNLFSHIMCWLGVMTYSGTKIERLRQAGQLIVANHPTLIDVVFLIAKVKRADCIVKGDLLKNPFMRGAIKFAGYIVNDDPGRVVELASASLKRGNSLVIFPEGTRSSPDQPLKLMRGAANIAIRAGYNLTPVVIICRPLTLGRGDRWYHIPTKRIDYSVRVGNQIYVDPFIRHDRAIAARRLTQYLEIYLQKESGWDEWTSD